MPRLTLPALAAALLLAACGDEVGPVPGDVVGPFTGTTTRYVVDRLDLPTNNADARAAAADLDGDGIVDNQAGLVLGTLATMSLGNTHGADLLASGALTLTVELQADDLTNDPTVRARVSSGISGDVPLGGRLVGGDFASNRTRTTGVPGATTLVLPILADTAPSVLPAVGLELDLTADGHGGFDGALHGGFEYDPARTAMVAALQQAVTRNPGAHDVLMAQLDANRDGQVSDAEGFAYPLLQSLLTADVTLRDGARVVSFGLRFHLIACATGTCVSPPPAPTCFDGVPNGDESELDCGGSCALKCTTGHHCATAADCDAGVCTPVSLPDTGSCAAPRCDDGRRDGYETGVDCGGPYCGAC